MKKTAFILGAISLSIATFFLLIKIRQQYVTDYTGAIINEQPPKPVAKIKTLAVDVFSQENQTLSPFEMPKITQPLFSDVDKVCNIIDYGASAEGNFKNTKAINDAINDCSAHGGGKVEIPAGKWLTGAIKLKDNVNLHLDRDATIIFSSNPEDYLPAVFSRYEGIDFFGYSPFIYSDHATNIAITGSGTLDGQGNLWWPKNNMNATYSLYQMAANNIPAQQRNFANENMMLRPSFIQFNNSNSILLEGVTIKNSPMWTVHPLYSSNIIIRDIKVQTLGLNTDGIAIDSSKNILIEDSSVMSGDDALVIKAGRDSDGLRVNRSCENIIIRNISVSEGHGGIALGSETSGGIKNVFAYNLNLGKTTFGIRLKSSIGRGGTVENIWFDNISSRNITNTAIQFTTNYDQPYSTNDTAIPHFNNINISNFSASKASNAISMVGITNDPLQNVNLSNISINSKEGVKISNSTNSQFKNVKVVSRYKPTYDFSGVKNLIFNNLSCKNSNDCKDLVDTSLGNTLLKK